MIVLLLNEHDAGSAVFADAVTAAGITPDSTLQAYSTDAVTRYQPHALPCLLMVEPCGCVVYECSDVAGLVTFTDDVAAALIGFVCRDEWKSIEAKRSIISSLIAERNLKTELGEDATEIQAAIAELKAQL